MPQNVLSQALAGPTFPQFGGNGFGGAQQKQGFLSRYGSAANGFGGVSQPGDPAQQPNGDWLQTFLDYKAQGGPLDLMTWVTTAAPPAVAQQAQQDQAFTSFAATQPAPAEEAPRAPEPNGNDASFMRQGSGVAPGSIQDPISGEWIAPGTSRPDLPTGLPTPAGGQSGEQALQQQIGGGGGGTIKTEAMLSSGGGEPGFPFGQVEALPAPTQGVQTPVFATSGPETFAAGTGLPGAPANPVNTGGSGLTTSPAAPAAAPGYTVPQPGDTAAQGAFRDPNSFVRSPNDLRTSAVIPSGAQQWLQQLMDDLLKNAGARNTELNTAGAGLQTAVDKVQNSKGVSVLDQMMADIQANPFPGSSDALRAELEGSLTRRSNEARGATQAGMSDSAASRGFRGGESDVNRASADFRQRGSLADSLAALRQQFGALRTQERTGNTQAAGEASKSLLASTLSPQMALTEFAQNRMNPEQQAYWNLLAQLGQADMTLDAAKDTSAYTAQKIFDPGNLFQTRPSNGGDGGSGLGSLLALL